MKKSFLVLACIVFCCGSVEWGMGMMEEKKDPTAEQMLKEIQDLKVPDTLTSQNIDEYLNHLQKWPHEFKIGGEDMNDDFYITTASEIATKFNALIDGVKGTIFEAKVIADYFIILIINEWNDRLDKIKTNDSSKEKGVEETKKLLHENPIVNLLVMQKGVNEIELLNPTEERSKNTFKLAFNVVKLYKGLFIDNNYKELLCSITHQDCVIPGLFKIIFSLPYTTMKTWFGKEFITKDLKEYKKSFLLSIDLYINSEFPKNKTIYKKIDDLFSKVLEYFYIFFAAQQKTSEELENMPGSLSGNSLENYKTAKAELFSDLKKIFKDNKSLVQLLEVLNIELKTQEELKDDAKNPDNVFKDYATLLKILEKKSKTKNEFLRGRVIWYIQKNIKHIIKIYQNENKPEQLKILLQSLIKKCHDNMCDSNKNWFINAIKEEASVNTSILNKIITTEKNIFKVFKYLSLDPLSKEKIEEYLLKCNNSLMTIKRIESHPNDEFYRDYFIQLNTALTKLLTKIENDDSLEKFLFFESRFTETIVDSIEIIKSLNVSSQEVKKDLGEKLTKTFKESLEQMTLYADSSKNNLYKAGAIVLSIIYERAIQVNKNYVKKFSDLSKLLKKIIDNGEIEKLEKILLLKFHDFKGLIELFFHLFLDSFNEKFVEKEDINCWFYIYSKYIETITDKQIKINEIMQMYECIVKNSHYGAFDAMPLRKKFKDTFTMYGLPLYFDVKMLFENRWQERPEINFYIKLSNVLTESTCENLDENVSPLIKNLFHSKTDWKNDYLRFYEKACTEGLKYYKKILETLAKKITTWIIPGGEIDEYKKSFLSSFYFENEEEKEGKLVEELFGGSEELLKETFDEFPAIPKYITFSWSAGSICTKDSSKIREELNELSTFIKDNEINEIDPLIQKYVLSPDNIWTKYLEGNNNLKAADFHDVFEKGYDVFTNAIDKLDDTGLIKEANIKDLIRLALKWYLVYDALTMNKLNPMEYLKKIVDISDEKNQINAIVNIMKIADHEIGGRNFFNQIFLKTFKATFVQLNKDLEVPIDIVFASFTSRFNFWDFERNLMQGLNSQKEFDVILHETLLSLNAIKNIKNSEIIKALKDSNEFNDNIGDILGSLYAFEAFELNSFPAISLKINNRLQDIKDCISLYKNETLCGMMKNKKINIHCLALENRENHDGEKEVERVKAQFFALFTVDPLQQALMLLKAKLLHLAQTLGEK